MFRIYLLLILGNDLFSHVMDCCNVSLAPRERKLDSSLTGDPRPTGLEESRARGARPDILAHIYIYIYVYVCACACLCVFFMFFFLMY